MTSPMLVFSRVSKTYDRGADHVHALRDVSFEVPAGQFAAVVGPSGSGKSTLLHLAGALDEPSSGDVLIGGQRLSGLGDAGRTQLRRSTIGFVFQFFNLLPTMTARENAMLPALLAGVPVAEANRRVERLLGEVGLGARMDHRPDELSGGEMQRTALARALVTNPRLLLADEPTGNLDQHTGEEIFALIRALARRDGTAILVVTHDPNVARRADRRITVRDGTLVSDEYLLEQAPPAASGPKANEAA
jgi:putative ABC transport system ATP-binding protein